MTTPNSLAELTNRKISYLLGVILLAAISSCSSDAPALVLEGSETPPATWTEFDVALWDSMIDGTKSATNQRKFEEWLPPRNWQVPPSTAVEDFRAMDPANAFRDDSQLITAMTANCGYLENHGLADWIRWKSLSNVNADAALWAWCPDMVEGTGFPDIRPEPTDN